MILVLVAVWFVVAVFGWALLAVAGRADEIGGMK